MLNYDRIRQLYTLDGDKPTNEQIDEADKRYCEECRVLYESGYSGDFGCGLEFAMATYGPIMWCHLFKEMVMEIGKTYLMYYQYDGSTPYEMKVLDISDNKE